MPLQPDQTLLHYRLIEQIGEGGMGVVWKAEDTSLHREVAIKVLPTMVSQDPERLVRFDREAKLLASLNHANIASVYGLHEDGDVRFLAMEFVQGEDLAKRLARGRMSTADALGIARQVADALQSAHENGVVHRDLKPANILFTPEGQAKVLDFGLAKAFEADPSSPVNPTLSPTLTSAGTVAGVILGTAAYMSPEQARGEPVDKRTDVWAFGCLLFEMLAGRMTFKEKTVSDTLASVLKVEPDWSLLPADVPESIHRLLQRCIQKDPRQRLHDIADARIEIEETLAAPRHVRPAAATTARPRARLALTAVFVLLGIAAGLAVGRMLAPSAPEQRVRRFFLPFVAQEGQQSLRGTSYIATDWRTPVISPDGRMITYVFNDKLWLHDFEQVKPRPLDGTAGARLPFWSPDGSQIGYRVDESLWRISTSGGQPSLICNRAPHWFAGTWGADETIVFSDLDEMLEVSARGGEPTVIFEPNDETERHFHEVHRLPGGRGLVVVLHREEPDTIALWADGKRKTLFTLESAHLSYPTYSPTGHILFAREDKNEGVWALPFSLSSLEVTGEPFLVVPQGTAASASADGTLVYMDARAGEDMELVWFDANGMVLGTIGQPQEKMSNPVISPDGTKVAVSASENDHWDIWIHDVGDDSKHPLTFDPDREGRPSWSADGSRILYHSRASGKLSIYTVEVDGSGEPLLLTEGGWATVAGSGAHMVFHRPGEETKGDLWSMLLEGDGEPMIFLQTEAEEQQPALSPDGRFVAYTSDESGEVEVYIKPFPEGSGKWQVSVDGGRGASWSPVGDRLYFVAHNSLMEVEVSTDPVLRVGRPRVLIDKERTKLMLWRGFAVAEDGTRFVGARPQEEDEGQEQVEDGIHVVENWFLDFED